jgi:hypothetical protein
LILSFASETYFRFESFDDVWVSDGIVPYVVIFLHTHTHTHTERERERERRERKAMLKGRGVKNVRIGRGVLILSNKKLVQSILGKFLWLILHQKIRLRFYLFQKKYINKQSKDSFGFAI